MKKLLSLLVILSLVLLSCAKSRAPADGIASEVLSQAAIPYAKRYVFGTPEYSDKYLDGDLSFMLYGCDIYECCSDFSIALCKKDVVSELHILVAQSNSKADRLRGCLEERIMILRDKEIYMYDMENAENINAMIYQNGLYVCLVAGPSSEIMYERLCELIK